MSTNNNFHIRVAIRTRPLLASDYQRIPNHAQGLATAVHVLEDNNSIVVVDPVSAKPTHQFFFDKVFHPEESTEDVYNIVAKHIVYHAVKGYNGTIFAYGQTSTGKTHTVFGHSEAYPGLVPMAVNDIFDQIDAAGKTRMFFVRIAVMEIYNEKLTDLAVLDPKLTGQQPKFKPLRIRETQGGFIFVENLVEEVCTTRENAHYFLNDCLTRRHMAQTLANQDSSRSHVICRIVVESRPIAGSSRASLSTEPGEPLVDYDQAPTTIGELNFVDLAGSECAVRIITPNTSSVMNGSIGSNKLPPETVMRLKEGRAINRSLLMLGIVINQLAENRSIVNYRNSKLTRILQNALGGNSLTAIVCTISPTEADKRQSVSTLQFASNAKSIKTKPRLNETYSPDQAILRRLQLEIERLRRRIVELEMQQMYASSSNLNSSSGERQQLHENERLLLNMIAGGKGSKSRQNARRNTDSQVAPALSRRMTWAPTESGHALLMFTGDEQDRPATRLEISNDSNGERAKSIVFHGMLEKVTSQDMSSSLNGEDSTMNQSRSESQESGLSPSKSLELAKLEPIGAVIDRIENEEEFRERFVGRQYFETVAKNYEKLKNVLEQSLGTEIQDDDDFSSVSDKISFLVAKSRQNSQVQVTTHSHSYPVSRNNSTVKDETTVEPLVPERPATSVMINFGHDGSLSRSESPSSRMTPVNQPIHFPAIKVIRRTCLSARLPPIKPQSEQLRTKSSIGSFEVTETVTFNGQSSNVAETKGQRPFSSFKAQRPMSRASTITLTDYRMKHLEMQHEENEDQASDAGQMGAANHGSPLHDDEIEAEILMNANEGSDNDEESNVDTSEYIDIR